MIKKNLILFAIIALTLLTCGLSRSGPDPVEIVNKFFEAKKKGDVYSIKKFISGPLYKSRKDLLELNKDYPKILRKYYAGTEIIIEDTVVGHFDIFKKDYPILFDRYQRFRRSSMIYKNVTDLDQIAIVIAKCRFPDGNNFTTKFLLINDHNWKIYDEILVR